MKNRKKKIVFFSRDLNIGGMEKALVNILNNLDPSKYRITLILENKAGELLDYLHKDIIVKEYRLSKSSNKLLRKLCNFLHRCIWSVFNYRKYDFSCSYATYSVIGSRLALIASENSSLYVHSDYHGVYNGNIQKICDFFNELSIEKFSNIIFVSNESKSKIEEIYKTLKSRFSVIGNIIDYENIVRLSEDSVDYEKNNDKITLLFVGRLEEESKNLTTLIKSFEIVSKKSDAFELIIIGDGKDRALCEHIIAEKCLEDKIFLFGKKQNPYAYMKKADCLILTSNYEGYPVIYHEGLVLNQNIITTIPVSDDSIDIRDFAVISENDIDSIAKTILHSDYEKKIYNLNFEEINRRKIKKMEKIIEENQDHE